ncbi:MAG: hypothetical protein HPY71_09240 [Firmicutes bacterium]|nr:hypothetical protein [Bacillota bacterium]
MSSGRFLSSGVMKASVMKASSATGLGPGRAEFLLKPVAPRQAAPPAQDSPDRVMQRAMENARAVLEEAGARAREIVEDAGRAARATLDEAESRRAEIEEAARLAGYEEGYQRGREEALEQAGDLIRLLGDARDALVALRRDVIRGAENDIVELAVGIAEKIVHREIEVDESVVLGMVKEALLHVRDSRAVRIRVSPWDVERVAAFRDDLVKMVSDAGDIEILQDPRVEQGGCIIETEFGMVDARIRRQFSEVKEVLQDGHSLEVT